MIYGYDIVARFSVLLGLESIMFAIISESMSVEYYTLSLSALLHRVPVGHQYDLFVVLEDSQFQGIDFRPGYSKVFRQLIVLS